MAHFFEFESRIFHNIGPFKYVLHRKVNSHDKINLIIYFKNLIIELNVFYVVTIHVKFHLNKKLITFQYINTRQMDESGRVWVKSIDLCKKLVILSKLKMGRLIKL